VASEELADRIEAVSQPLAERILGRAVELDAEQKAAARDASATLDYETLKSIALEVGITEEALKKALLEELDTDKDHGATPSERVTVPDTVRGGLIVPGSADELAARLDEFVRRTRAQVEVTPQGRTDRHLVSINIGTRPARRRAWVWILALVIFGPMLAQAAGAALGIGLFVFGVAAVVGWVRRIGRKVRRTVNQALNSILDDQVEEPKSWLELWERATR
jgi:hypothetical protein